MTTEAFVYEVIRTPRGRGKQNGSLHGTKPVFPGAGLPETTAGLQLNRFFSRGHETPFRDTQERMLVSEAVDTVRCLDMERAYELTVRYGDRFAPPRSLSVGAERGECFE